MIHYGDITALSGYHVPPTDCVIGGSPCQNLSIAGNRKGLAGAQSRLFLEQIRIVKEMRNADIHRGRTGQFIRPRFMVWENVVGAFSSNKGEDYRIVLEETIRIAEPEAPDIPLPSKGKWPLADCWMGDGWSVAYRVLDAQFWGVPQRRRRIALVADFGGHAAPEILFIRESVCGDSPAGGTPGEKTSAGLGSSTYSAIAGSLTVRIECAGFKHKAGEKAESIGHEMEKAPTLSAKQTSAVYDARGNGDGKNSCTLTGDHQRRITDYTAIVFATGQAGAEITENLSPTLNCNHEQPIVCNTLRASPNDPHRADMATYPITPQGDVRRLTPLECERLQGYPDGWTDIGSWTDSRGRKRECSDAARYKALGNSIALPPWKWMLKRLCACYERDATMASLFDGIGGFPLIWEQINGSGSCLWVSEIEEFPIAVTRRHFKEGS